MAWFWVALGILLLAVEVYTTALFALFIGVGSFPAALVAWWGGSVVIQVSVGAIVALAGAGLARPIVVRLVQRRSRALPQSLSGLVGRTGLTADLVGDEHHPGHVVLNGERWLANTADSRPLDADVPVVVTAVHGTTLVVQRR